MNDLPSYLKNTTLPIKNFVLARNYLREVVGNNVTLGENYIHSMITKECFDKMLEVGFLKKLQGCDNWYTFYEIGE